MPMWAFFTITAPSYENLTPLQTRDISYKLFKAQWNTFFTALKRYLGYKPSYIRVFELQKRGAVHAHVLINTNFLRLHTIQEGENAGKTYEEWIAKNASVYGFGFMSHATNLESDNIRVALYVTKYMSKGDTQETMWLPKNARYIQNSRDFKPLSETSKNESGEGSWIKLSNKLSYELQRFEIYDVKKKRIVKISDLDENNEYY